jgi:hypothetical protein
MQSNDSRKLLKGNSFGNTPLNSPSASPPDIIPLKYNSDNDKVSGSPRKTSTLKLYDVGLNKSSQHFPSLSSPFIQIYFIFFFISKLFYTFLVLLLFIIIFHFINIVFLF